MWKTILILIMISYTNTLYAEIYKWIDNNGKIHFSDRVTTTNPIETIDTKVVNTYNYLQDWTDTNKYISRIDAYTLPFRRSSIPFRFSLSSGINQNEPIDRLNFIKIDIRQKGFYAYVKLIGIEQQEKYRLRIRVLDAKGELIFDKDNVVDVANSNSAWFFTIIFPNVHTDASGQWTIQAILNNEILFVEKRGVFF